MREILPVAMLTLAGLLLAAGCSAPYVDQEFGQASKASWEQQIINPDPTIHADATPEEQRGIISEEVMDVHTQTFGERPRQVDVFQLGVEN